MMDRFLKKVREFLTNESGSAGSEFVVSLPLLIGVMVIASEYGSALQVRDALDSATRDVTRFLARAPLNAAGDDFAPHFKTEAEAMINDRLGGGARIVSVLPTIIEAPGTSGQFRSDYYVVGLGVLVEVDMSLLSLLDLGTSASISSVQITSLADGKPTLEYARSNTDNDISANSILMVAVDTTRYDGPGPLDDNLTCTWVMEYQGTC